MMPYKTITITKRNGLPTILKDIKLTLVQINSIANYYNIVKKAGKATPMSVCISAFYKTHKISGNRWINKK